MTRQINIESTLRHAASLADEIKPEWYEHDRCDDCPICELYDDLIEYINAQLRDSGSNHDWCADTPTQTYCTCDLAFDGWCAFITHCLPPEGDVTTKDGLDYDWAHADGADNL